MNQDSPSVEPVRAEPSLTHRDIAASLGVTVTTIKSYRRKFPEFFADALGTRPIRFPSRAGEVCARILALFASGFTVEQVRERLGREFPVAAPEPPGAPANPSTAPLAAALPDPLARIEGLLEGLFTLQNRTHSLLAELVSRLDTVADALAAKGATDASARPAARSSAPSGAQAAAQPSTPAGAPAAGRGAPAGASAPPRPGREFLGLPVVVLSGDGEYLGVTSKGGRPFSLSQFEVFLASRAKALGAVESAWRGEGQEWVLSLVSGGQAHDHHFIRAVTPKGNAVARFAALSVGGRTVSDAALQAFLRQVKESLHQ